MQVHTILFYLFASITLISSIMVIVAKNPIHSVISLILVFTNVTGLLILLKIEFIAMMFIIIYVGAIAVLFLFVVMMLNIKLNELSENLIKDLENPNKVDGRVPTLINNLGQKTLTGTMKNINNFLFNEIK